MLEFQVTGAHSNLGPTELPAGRSGGSNPGRNKRYFSSPKCPDRFWNLPSSVFSVYRGYFLQVKRLGHDVGHSQLSSAEVEN
jgi:hypothetical protein